MRKHTALISFKTINPPKTLEAIGMHTTKGPARRITVERPDDNRTSRAGSMRQPVFFFGSALLTAGVVLLAVAMSRPPARDDAVPFDPHAESGTAGSLEIASPAADGLAGDDTAKVEVMDVATPDAPAFLRR